MKKIAASLSAALVIFLSLSAHAQSCCKKPEGNSMKALALNKSFKASHEAPAPLNYVPQKGSMVQIAIPGQPDGGAFFVPADSPANDVLIVFHEWWGLNDYIRREAENWQKLLGGNVDVYAVDLYDGKVAVTPDDAGKLASGLEPQRAEDIIAGLVKKIGKNKKIATIGWCMGGSWSFTASVLASDEAAGCVMYYGFPEKNANRIKPLQCDVLYIRGSRDNFIKKSDVDEFETKVRNTGHDINTYSFDAVHAFANPSNPKYDVRAAGDAQLLAMKFLKEKLSIK